MESGYIYIYIYSVCVDWIHAKHTNIIPYLEFELYETCWYLYPVYLLSNETKLGIWLVVSRKVVQYLCYCIFPDRAITIACTTFQPLIDEERQMPGV